MILEISTIWRNFFCTTKTLYWTENFDHLTTLIHSVETEGPQRLREPGAFFARWKMACFRRTGWSCEGITIWIEFSNFIMYI